MAGLYDDVTERFVLDEADREETGSVNAHDLEAVLAPALVHRDPAAAPAPIEASLQTAKVTV